MIKYIVTWIVSTIISAPCPSIPVEDEFGIISDSYITCAVYHTATIDEVYSKEFYSKDSVFVFYEKGKLKALNLKNSMFASSVISQIKIDSIIINN